MARLRAVGPRIGMAGRVLGAAVGLDLDDPARNVRRGHQQLVEQARARHGAAGRSSRDCDRAAGSHHVATMGWDGRLRDPRQRAARPASPRATRPTGPAEPPPPAGSQTCSAKRSSWTATGPGPGPAGAGPPGHRHARRQQLHGLCPERRMGFHQLGQGNVALDGVAHQCSHHGMGLPERHAPARPATRPGRRRPRTGLSAACAHALGVPGHRGQHPRHGRQPARSPGRARRTTAPCPPGGPGCRPGATP